MTTLTITSLNQGFGYTEGASVQAFAVIEKLAGFAGSLLQAVRGLRDGGAALRPAQA